MDNNQSTTITDPGKLAGAGGGDNVSEETISFHELVNKELGTNYVDAPAALQGLKQTKDYVGRVGQVMPFFDKAKEKGIPTSKLFEAMDTIINAQEQKVEPVVQKIDTDQFVTKDELNRQLFYKDNPQYQPYQELIDATAKAQGVTADKVVSSDAFKPFFEKAKGFEEIEKTKSVLQTNQRLGVASDSFTKAADAAKTGDMSGAQKHAMDAVMEAYPQK